MRERAEQLNPWYYCVPIGKSGYRTMPGIGSKQDYNELVARQNYRYKMLVKPILERYDFRDKHIIDVACNCAYWSSQYVLKGKAKVVFGIEGRDLYVEQAYLYWVGNNILPISNIGFIKKDVMDEELWSKVKKENQFDFALCAGILYHVSDYKWLLDKICKATKEAVVVDTRVSEDEKKIIEPGGWHFDGIGKKVVKVNPSIDGIKKVLKDNGFDSIEIIPHAGAVPPEMKNNDDYEAGKRVTIFAKK